MPQVTENTLPSKRVKPITSMVASTSQTHATTYIVNKRKENVKPTHLLKLVLGAPRGQNLLLVHCVFEVKEHEKYYT